MDYNESKEYLKRYLKARIPVITIHSSEKNRIIRLIREVEDELNYSFTMYNMSDGMVDLKTGEIVNDEKTIMSALDYISDEIRVKNNCNFILSNISDIDESTVVSRYLVDIISKAENSSSVIIIISSEPIWENIAKLGIGMKIAYPTVNEIKDTIINTIKPYEGKISIEWDNADYVNAATYLQGLSEMEVKNIISSLIVNGVVKKDDLKELKYTKQRLFNEIAGLEAIEIAEDFEIAGLDVLKKWIEEKKELIDPNRKDELAKRGITPPKGVLFAGIPGCGKSLCAKAISNIFNIPLYRLDLATVQGEYVGQSERQLKAAFDTAEYVSPCVLWIDEIEKGFNDNNSAVTSKLIGQFLFWLQENKKPVFVVASANNIDTLPAELVRKGRFDEIFFVDLPNKSERKALLVLYAKKYLKVEIGGGLLDKLVDITKGFASADIEASIRNIAYKLIANTDFKLTESSLIEELSRVVSISKTNPEKIEKIKKWCEERAVSASLKDEL